MIDTLRRMVWVFPDRESQRGVRRWQDTFWLEYAQVAEKIGLRWSSHPPDDIAVDGLTAGDPREAAQAAGQPDQPQPWLLNLDDDCPPGFDAFDRLLEIVSDDPDDRQAARQRWRIYQTAGHAPQSHDLSRKTPGA